MARVSVSHSIGDLAADLDRIAAKAHTNLSRIVERNAERGNQIARDFASEQHTMHSDIDAPYARSFSAEQKTPLSWEYGPVDDGIPHGGSQARGYEWGSRNQRTPHMNLTRSQDVIGPEFGDDVHDETGRWFW